MPRSIKNDKNDTSKNGHDVCEERQVLVASWLEGH